MHFYCGGSVLIEAEKGEMGRLNLTNDSRPLSLSHDNGIFSVTEMGLPRRLTRNRPRLRSPP
jgi:hypothetical protein